MKEITDKMRLDFIEASGAMTVTALNKWAIYLPSCTVAFYKSGETEIRGIYPIGENEFKPTLREAIDAAIFEDATYN